MAMDRGEHGHGQYRTGYPVCVSRSLMCRIIRIFEILFERIGFADHFRRKLDQDIPKKLEDPNKIRSGYGLMCLVE